MSEKLSVQEILSLTTDIVSAHVSNNEVETNEIPSLIQKVYGTLSNVNKSGLEIEDKPAPAVPIKKSITPDYLICLEDGKKLKMLKRHLRAVYDMSIEDYRQRWGLPADYPTVAPNYAKQRSQLAKNIGLGTSASRQKAS